jgi:multidrug efflux pump subunit AcrA (membrane-fusion protein)
MLARIRVQVEQRENVVVAPKSALTVTARRKGEHNLYRAVIAQGGKAVERFVVLGLEEGDRVEIVEGLAAGDALIVKGQHLLADGDPVGRATSASRSEAAAAKTEQTQEEPAAPQAEPTAPTEG